MAETLKDKTASGLLWGAMSSGGMQLLNLAFGIIIGRILMPEDYGMIGILLIFSSIASVLQESGFTSALINQKEIRHEDYNAVFWFSVLMGTGIYVILFFCAPLIARFYHQPALTSLARYAFIGFVIASLGIAHNAMLMKTLRVKQNAIVQMISLTISGIVGIIMALMGMAYWGIATQSIVYVTGVALGRWYCSGWHPTFSINLRPLKGMIGFSVKILASNIITQINNNVLTVILGRFYPVHEVGYYNQANKWNQMGFSTIQGMINGVAQPVLREVESDSERLIRVFRKMLRFASFVSMPAMFCLALVAPELITIAITEKWLSSAHLMQILCIGGAFLPIQNLMYNMLISRNRSDLCMWITLVFCITQIVTELICASYGIKTMVIAFVIVNILWLFIWWYFVWKETGVRLWHTLKDILPFTLIAAFCVSIAGYVATFTDNIYLSFVIKVIVTVVCYVALMYLSGAQTFRECMGFLLKKFKK